MIGRLRRLLFGAPRPKGSDFHSLARKARRVPDAELAIAEAALAGGGPIADRLVRQLREAGDVWRHVAEDGSYELRISTTDDVRVRDVPREGWTSPWIPTVAMPAGRSLDLQIFVFEAGILELLGRTADGKPWPARWLVRAGDLEAIRAQAPWLVLPSPAQLREQRAAAAETIVSWLGDPDTIRGRRGDVRVNSPATAEQIEAFEATHQFMLPEAYRSLLQQADGIEVGTLTVLGTGDAYRLDIAGPARLVITPPDEDGALTLAESGEVVSVDIADETSDGRVVAPDLRAWLKRKRGR